MKKLLIALLILFSFSSALAADIDCDSTTLQAAIDAASDGDTISCKAGSFTWTASPVIQGKGLKIEGKGTSTETGTVISQASKPLIIYTKSAYSLVDISKLRFTKTATGHSIQIYNDDNPPIANASPIFRIHENYFNAAAYTDHVIKIEEQVYGLIDNNHFQEYRNSAVAVTGNNTSVAGNEDQGLWTWGQTLSLGSHQAVYIENNTFYSSTYSYTAYPSAAGKIVLRHNTLNGAITSHSGCTGGRWESLWWEVYSNSSAFPEYSNMIWFRSNSGLMWNNDFTIGNGTIGIDRERSYRTDCNNTYRNINRVCNGSQPYDGNEAIGEATTSIYGSRLGTGTHTAADGPTLIDTSSSGTWTTNAFARSASRTPTGTHVGADSPNVLTKDSLTSKWGNLAMVGLHLSNVTDGSSCTITSNGLHTATCNLAGGSDNTWQSGDTFLIRSGVTVWNLSDPGAKCLIASNDGTSVTCQLEGGSYNYWKTGDQYKITDGWPCLHQAGYGPIQNTGTTASASMGLSPAFIGVFAWDNMKTSGTPVEKTLGYSGEYIAQEAHLVFGRELYTTGTSNFIVGGAKPATCTAATGTLGRDIYVDTTDANKPVIWQCSATDTWTQHWTPFTCPHPLAGTGTCSAATPGRDGYSITNETPATYYDLTLNIAGTGVGTVTSPSIATCSSGTCTYNILADSSIVLTRNTASGSDWTGWSGAVCTGTGATCSFTMDAAKEITATFDDSPDMYALTITYAGTGTGVTDPVAGTYPKDDGDAIAPTNIPGDNSTFGGWSGSCGCTGTGACSFNMPASACEIIATFTDNSRKTLTVAYPSNGEIITDDLSRIICGGTDYDCQYNYYATETPTLSTVCADGWYGATYGDDCSGASCGPLDMSADKSVSVSCRTTSHAGGSFGGGTR